METKNTDSQQKPQYFYFNNNGQLIVESNKGVWVDGTPYVKMYDNFTCNAKTMGIIIAHFKNLPVILKEDREICCLPNGGTTVHTTAIVNPTDEDKELLDKLAAREAMIQHQDDRIAVCERAIVNYNALPWHKRIFRKVKI